ncbi:MAG: UDP-glucose/GDP-mannose dehydrogenase family protein [Terriglobia bacterium]
MHISILGSGYVGLVTGAGLADLGLTVTCVDIDQAKIQMLQDGKVPIYEPGLEDLLRRNRQRGRLHFSTDIAQAVRNSLVSIIAVGTDAGPDGTPDLSQVWSAADSIAAAIDGYRLVVLKSTVPVGTTAELHERIAGRLRQPQEFDVAFNPEFLREGSAVEDFFHPSRIVIGTNSPRAAAIMKDIYRPLYLIQTPFVFTTWECSELIKYAANAFLALKVTFINEVANLCDAIGPNTDVHVIAHALGLDPRVGPKFLHPGPGYGGYCFPKDTRGLCQIARRHGIEFKTIEAAVAVNDAQYLRVVEKVRKGLGSMAGKSVGVLGLSFKPNTDDIRESRAVKICTILLADGCKLRVYDPVAMTHAARVLGTERVEYCPDAYQAAMGCDALVVATEWNEFRNLDLAKVRKLMPGDILVDSKNIFEIEKARSVGFRYFGMGRH